MRSQGRRGHDRAPEPGGAGARELAHLRWHVPRLALVGGRQYVATPSGWGSLAAQALVQYWPETRFFTGGATIFAFALPEGAP